MSPQSHCIGIPKCKGDPEILGWPLMVGELIPRTELDGQPLVLLALYTQGSSRPSGQSGSNPQNREWSLPNAIWSSTWYVLVLW